MSAEKRALDVSETVSSVILLDIEGTTTSINFVKETLFPYVRTNLEQYVKDHWADEQFKTVCEKLIAQAATDIEEKLEGAVPINKDEEDAEKTQKALVANVLWQMDEDRKSGPLKVLQGHIYQGGYANGDLKGHVFSDVPPALKEWKEAGKQVYIYSSGSVEAQKLLFTHSTEGNLLEYIDGHFDTEVGPKVESKSYTNIAEKVGKKAEEITFYTDVVKEAEAAKEAGLRVILMEREGNEPLAEDIRSAFTTMKVFPTEVSEESASKKAKLEEEVADVEMKEEAESATEKPEEEQKIEETEEPKEQEKIAEPTETKAEEEPQESKDAEKAVEINEEEKEDDAKDAVESETPDACEPKETEKEENTEEAKSEDKVEESKVEEEKTESDKEIDAGEAVKEKEAIPHENGVNGTNGVEHTNGVDHTNGTEAEKGEELPKEASPVKKVVCDAAGDAAESAVAAE